MFIRGHIEKFCLQRHNLSVFQFRTFSFGINTLKPFVYMCAKLHLRVTSFELKMWCVIKLSGVARSEERKMASSMDLHIKQRAVIEFLTTEGCSPIEIYSHMKPVYGDLCLHVSSREENSSESTVHDQARTGRPLSALYGMGR